MKLRLKKPKNLTTLAEVYSVLAGAPHLPWPYVSSGALGFHLLTILDELAMNELTYVLARMVQRFEKIERIDSEPWIEDISLGTTSAHGAKVVAVVG